MLPKGSFLVFGPEAAPTVHLLSEQETQLYYDRDSLVDSAKGRREVMRVTFNQPMATTALPAWSNAAMLDATHYEGPFQTEVRGIAAAIALGKPFSKDQPNGRDDGSGGSKVPRKPKPTGKGPSALQQLMSQDAA